MVIARPVGSLSNSSPASRKSVARRRNVRWRRIVAPLLPFVVWFVGSATGLISSEKLPAIQTVAESFWQLLTNGILARNMEASLDRVVIGLSLGVAIGTILALAAGLNRVSDDFVDPNMQMLRTLPVLALVPLFVVWFGIGEESKDYIIALVCAIPIYLNLYSGLRGVDRKLIESGRTLGLSKFQLIRHVMLPGAMAPFLVGLRLAVGFAWLLLVAVEQINATSGLGAMMIQAEQYSETQVVFVGLLVYAFLGLSSDALIRYLERKVLRWRSG